MPQRHAYWVIVTGTSATAFRSRYRDDLVPTLFQLQRTAPDAELKWFDRGKLWESPAAARDALELERRQRRPQNREWRPGGDHKDPRARFKLTRDQKRARFKRRRTGKPPDRPAGPDDFSGQRGGDASRPRSQPPRRDTRRGRPFSSGKPDARGGGGSRRQESSRWGRPGKPRNQGRKPPSGGKRGR